MMLVGIFRWRQGLVLFLGSIFLLASSHTEAWVQKVRQQKLELRAIREAASPDGDIPSTFQHYKPSRDLSLIPSGKSLGYPEAVGLLLSHQTMRYVTNAMFSGFLAMLVLFAPFHSTLTGTTTTELQGRQFLAVGPPSAHATFFSPTVSPSYSFSSNDISDKSSFPMTTTTITLSDANSAIEEKQDNMLDEVWNLVDKYYLDRSKIQASWPQMKEQFAEKYQNAGSEKQRFAAVSEMVSTLGDKYSRMVDPDQYAAVQRFDLIGVGVTLMPDPGTTTASSTALTTTNTDDATQKSTAQTDTVAAPPTSSSKPSRPLIIGAPPLPGSAADKEGLQLGDVVLKVNGIPTAGRNALDVVDQLANAGYIEEAPTSTDGDTRGNNNFVTMTIVPKSHAKAENYMDFARDVTMQRSFVKVENPILYKITESRPDGTKIGFIRILEFNSLVQPKLEAALKALQAAGANAYVIDIRQNTGGAFQSAVELSSLFIEGSKIATIVVDNAQTLLPFRTAPDRLAINTDEPIVIWIDDRSASASEVFAGSLHDNCRAVTMGSKSFGKGLIQAVYGLKSGAGLILTVARYTTPNGYEIQGQGLVPDIPGHVALPIPGFSTDTSQVDFNEIKERLSMCKPPSAVS